MLSKRIKFILFVFLTIAISLPMIFSFLGYKNGKLGGYYEKKSMPYFSAEIFDNMEYQKRLEGALKQETGFSDFFIRLSNQFRYTFLGKASSNYIIVGKHDFLYTDSYVNSALGIDFQGKERIDSTIMKLSIVKDSLKNKGIDLIFIMAPGKGTYYPEYFPLRYSLVKRKPTNYQAYITAFKKYGIEYLDFNSWFLSLKGKTKYELFPNASVHWGQYACYLAVDSLTKYLDKKYSINLTRIKVKKINVSTQMQGTDDEVEKMVNCMRDIPNKPAPRVEFEYDTLNKDKLKVLTIGDSYFFGMNEFGLLNMVFDNSEFWYYMKEVKTYIPKFKSIADFDDIKKEIEKNKTIILIFTESNLHAAPIQIIDDLHYIFTSYPKYDNELLRQKEKYKMLIAQDEKWTNDILKKADKYNITLNEAIDKDAEFMAREYLKNKFNK